MIAFNKAEVIAKKERLAACAEYLKSEFIGIDHIIDEVINYLSLWYLMPDLLTRPIIINLWGMTGVGKTDLVRKLVKFLDYQDRFAEVELSNSDSVGYVNTVTKILDNNGITDGDPAIVLFDEIQRFNTLNPDGTPIKNPRFADFWELLSDGRLSKKTKDDLDTFLFDYLTKRRNNEKARQRGEEVSTDNSLSSWEAMNLRKSLGLNMDLAELIEINEDQMIELIMQAKQQKVIYEPIDHSKTLIIISGNLDEAFQMAGQISEADVDADIYHTFTQKITLVDIKNALSRKFRPEQVARFGNIHLIYTSLRKAEFERLIEVEVAKRCTSISEKFGVRVTVSKEIERLIYRNGVFPVQGVRPVFSSIIDILESNWNNFIFTALMHDLQAISIDYDLEAQEIVAQIGDRREAVPYTGRIDKIRQADKPDVVANISVHEAGHAVVFMVLTGMVPLQLKSKIANSYAGGFTFSHEIYANRQGLLDKIAIYLGGGLAEELVFGEMNASTGRSADRERISEIAVDYIRRYGFDPDFQAVYNHSDERYAMYSKPTDSAVEAVIAQEVDRTRELLRTHEQLLVSISNTLQQKGSLEGKELIDIAAGFGLSTRQEAKGYIHITNYKDKLDNYEG